MTLKLVQPPVPLTRAPLTRDQILAAALLMEGGGSFARHIGQAWLAGDGTNKQRVYDAFADLFAKYIKRDQS